MGLCLTIHNRYLDTMQMQRLDIWVAGPRQNIIIVVMRLEAGLRCCWLGTRTLTEDWAQGGGCDGSRPHVRHVTGRWTRDTRGDIVTLCSVIHTD